MPVQRGIALVVLFLLAVLPVSGTVCAALCVPAVNAASATGDGASASPCHDAASGEADVRGTAGHGCDRHDGTAREIAASLAPARTDIGGVSAGQYAGSALPDACAPTSVRVRSGSSPPPVTVSPTRTPLVLRI